MHRTASRFAARTLALAAVPMLLIAGCTSESGDSSAQDNQPSSQSPPSPAPVRFTDLPAPCSLLGKGTVREIVPEAAPLRGEALSSNDTSRSGTCLWTGLRLYQFRSLTVSLRRFESDVTLGSGADRAQEFLQQRAEEISKDEANEDVEDARPAKTGDAATSIGYSAVLETEDGGKQRYRQQRVIARTGNIVVTVDYAGTGFEDADLPSAEDIRENAETAAREVVEAVDTSESIQDSGAENGPDEGGAGDGETAEEAEQNEQDGAQEAEEDS